MNGTTSLLADIHCPADVRRLRPEELGRLAEEIREALVVSVSQSGGHLGPNLGVVELTIALHRVFDSPRDALVWDTGHQSYVHKMLTGRQGEFAHLRQTAGLSGYPNRAESEHDLVENSHASTALSYADGLAKARACSSERARRHVVAIVGDGALTGGMCWEALNNIACAPERPVVIVLNDNGRSYAPTVGAFAEHLRGLRAGSAAAPSGKRQASETTMLDDGSARHDGWVSADGWASDDGWVSDDGLHRRTLFEQLGLKYIGPVDGHDITAVEDALRCAVELDAPVVVHCVTRKGAGFAPAEADEADRLHTIAPAPRPEPAGGAAPRPPTVIRQSWTDVLGEELLDLAESRPDLVGVTAAMLRPTGLYPFACRFPQRIYDVGIAEQHAVTSAAGLAMAGMHPVVCIYATFLNRAFDQVLMDVGLHRQPVTFVLDRAGVTGSDGPSHNGMWDLSLLGVVPGMRVAAPRDAESLRELLREAVADRRGPTAVRFPKGDVGRRLAAFGRVGEGELLTRARSGDVLLLPVGPLAEAALEAVDDLAASDISSTVVDPRWVLPVDCALVDLAAEHRLVVTIEDNGASGGFGDAVGRALRNAGSDIPLRTLALPQTFLAQGSRSAMLAEHGLDAGGIASTVRTALGPRPAIRALG